MVQPVPWFSKALKLLSQLTSESDRTRWSPVASFAHSASPKPTHVAVFFFVELRYDVRLYIPRPRPRVWKKIGPPGLLLGSLIGVQISNPRRIQVHHWEFFSWATWRCGFWSWWSWLLMGFGAYWTPRSVAKFRILCRPPENPGSLIMPAQRDLAFVCSFVGLQGIVDQKVVGIWRFTSMLSC